MAKSKKRKTISKGFGAETQLRTFRRAIHSVANPRAGLSKARSLVSASHFPRIVNELGRQSAYKYIFAPTTFPKSLENFPIRTRLHELDTETELLWTASVLSIFKSDIYEFIIKKEEFERAFATEHPTRALEILEQIEVKFGFSLWLIGFKLQLLQLDKGLQAQKEYLESIFAADGMSAQATWIAYYFSIRSEENVSYSKIESDISQLGTGELADYCIHHVLGHGSKRIEHLRTPINYEEPNPIIDRFETFVTIAQQHLSRTRGEISDSFRMAVQLLGSLGDRRITNMMSALGQTILPNCDSAELRAADNYTIGQYLDVVSSDAESLELIARSRALLGNLPRSTQSSLRDRVIESMEEALSTSANAVHARHTLRKLALTLSKHPYSTQIWGFLERGHDHIFLREYSDLDRYVALNGHVSNPWNAAVYAAISNDKEWTKTLAAACPKSPAMLLRVALSSSAEGTHTLPPALPTYRKDAYEGHIAFRASDFKFAIEKYTRCAASEISYVAMTGKTYLFKALYTAKCYAQCLALIVDQAVAGESLPLQLPLAELAKKCLDESALLSSLDLSILLQILSKHVHPRWDRELSDIYENVIGQQRANRPTDLFNKPDFCSKSRFIYFLRNVCTTRILDDCTAFESMDDVESERIAICQHLLKIDAHNSASYQDEIRIITRDLNVALLLKKVQTSKIFVDEVGIRNAFEASLTDSLARYKELQNSPALTYQAQKLSKRIEEMIHTQGLLEFRDFKLPTSELEGLFHTMYLEVASQFAYSPAYGLDTHLSTTIRHGAFEGHLRGPLATEGLLCRTRNKAHYIPELTMRRLSHLVETEIDHVRRCLVRFTTRVEEMISTYLERRLRIKSSPTPDGMFALFVEPDSLAEISNTINSETTLDEVADRLVAKCWALADSSMEEIRLELGTSARSHVESAFTALIQNLEEKISRERLLPLTDAIARARTQYDAAVDVVSEWFRRPTDLIREPFEFDIAAHVALRQIANCYVGYEIVPILNVDVQGKLPGFMLDGICEILFILLQNVLLHSGYEDFVPETKVSARRENSYVVIEITNSLSESIDLIERRAQAEAAMARYSRDSALRLARKEGGSGLSKVWRIAEFDLRKSHSLNLSVTDDRQFTTTFRLGDVGETA